MEELDVWKRACRLAVRVYGVLKDCRDYGFKDQGAEILHGIEILQSLKPGFGDETVKKGGKW